MNLEQIEKLVGLVAKASVTEVTLRSEGNRITVRKPAAPAGRRVAATRGTSASTNGHSSGTDSVSGGALVPLDAGGTGTGAPDVVIIRAPMVGIFHHSEPPAAVGTKVTSGRVVGVIESMKLMNDVRAQTGGTVQEMLVEAGMAVEYGQPLLALSPDAPELTEEAEDEA